MRIAVTYDNGSVFQHFGQTEAFKIYDVENSKIVPAEVVSSNGKGHAALVDILSEKQVSVLICGGIGSGAQQALAAQGIVAVSGAEGNTDDAVEAFLSGELTDSGTTCHHHDHEEGHSCGESGCGGCHGAAAEFE